MIILYICLVIISICVIVLYVAKTEPKHVLVKSQTDGIEYIVRDTEDKQALADTLGNINNNIKKVIDKLSHEDKDGKLKYNINLIKSRYKPENIMENIYERDTSYTLDKGRKIVLCLESRDNNKFIYDTNLLTYVALHELAHVGSKTLHHTTEFKTVFYFLLEVAIKYGIYNHINFSQSPVNYCGYELN
jgi:predicted metal-dependent hydrolase